MSYGWDRKIGNRSKGFVFVGACIGLKFILHPFLGGGGEAKIFYIENVVVVVFGNTDRNKLYFYFYFYFLFSS